MDVIKMAKKQYRTEINNVTAEVLQALEGLNYKLYEVNEVKRESGSFASGSNFATTELLLNPVNESDDKEYTDQQLKNYCAGLQKDLYNKPIEKIVKL